MKRFWYHVRFAWHLWRNVPDMSWGEAWGYPIETSDGDPIPRHKKDGEAA